jgi:carboxymethylenebutenolidase
MAAAADQAAESYSLTDVVVPLPDGGGLKAALALPEAGSPSPGLLVLHESFGLNRDIRRLAGRLAGMGYVALAPDLFSHGNRLVCLTRVMMDAVRGAGSWVLSDLDAARTYLAERPEVDPARIGVIGFCQGGGFALAFAARGGLQVASVNYGAVPREAGALEGVCPVVASYGGADLIYGRQAQRLEHHLASLGVAHDVKTYRGAGHSFLSYNNAPAWMLRLPNPMHPGYQEAAAEDAWTRIGDFFAKYLTAG